MKKADKITFNAWDKDYPPKKILIIRLHAIGDTAITLPAAGGLKKIFPESEIDYLTGDLSAGLVKSLSIFNNVYSLVQHHKKKNRGKFGIALRDKIKAKKETVALGKILNQNKYDVIIDLQHNRNSLIIIRLCNVKYWSELDRFAPKSAAFRMLETFHNAGFKEVEYSYNLQFKDELIGKAKEILTANGWNENEKLIVLNPAGLWVTRNWPIKNYSSLAKLFLDEYDVKFLVIGDERTKDKSNFLETKLGDKLINLTGKTSLDEAFAILKHCALLISEDSALFHMAWAHGVPSVLMLGSTRSDWTNPGSSHVICLDSNDLPCGNCMEPECRFGDVHCLTRYAPELVFEKAKSLLAGN